MIDMPRKTKRHEVVPQVNGPTSRLGCTEFESHNPICMGCLEFAVLADDCAVRTRCLCLGRAIHVVR